MEAILEEMSKPLFWFVSIFVAGLISVAANLVSPSVGKGLNRRLSAASSWWRARSELRTARWEAAVEEIRSDPKTEHSYEKSEVRARLQSLQFFLLAILSALLAIAARQLAIRLPILADLAIVLNFIGLIAFAFVWRARSRAAMCFALVTEAQRRDEEVALFLRDPD